MKSISGPPTFLSVDQETRLVNYMLTMAKIGYGLTRSDIPDVVKDLLDRAEADGYVINKNKKFENNKPSKNWIVRFLNRHPEISARTPENLGFQRSYVTESSIRKWFDNLEEYLRTEHQIEAREFFTKDNGSRVFNLDESGFPLQGTSGKLQVITKRGIKNVYRMATDNREQITVLACASADGKFQKPLVLFPGIRTPKFNFKGVDPDKYDVGHSANGWMTSEVFFTWLSSLFYKAVIDKVDFPIIVFMDGHTSHINYTVSDFCMTHGIILYCFPAHASHILQPLDVSVFGPLKKAWNKSIESFKLQYKIAMTRNNFFQVFDKAWISAINSPNNVISGFKSTGLIPFDVDNVKFEKLVNPKHAEQYNESVNKHTESSMSTHEKLGFTRAFQIFKNGLPENLLAKFDTRFVKGDDVSEEDSILWKIYKELRQRLLDGKPSTVQEIQSVNTNQNLDINDNLEDTSYSEFENDYELPSIAHFSPNHVGEVSIDGPQSSSSADLKGAAISLDVPSGQGRYIIFPSNHCLIASLHLY